MDFKAYQCLRFSRQGRVLTVALNRPAQRNAVNAQLHTELSRVWTDLQRDADSDVIVLAGEGAAFCAGGDLAWMQSHVDDPAAFDRMAREGKDIAFGQIDLEKPLIAKVNGHATGLGASLALLSDIVLISADAKIGDPHVSVGLVAGDGGALIWPQLVGYAKARKYLFTGDLLSAAEAERIGLVTEVHPRDPLDAAAATLAMRYTKITANLPLRALFHAHFDAVLAYECLSNRSADHAEAVAAFRERRQPQFSGR